MQRPWGKFIADILFIHISRLKLSGSISGDLAHCFDGVCPLQTSVVSINACRYILHNRGLVPTIDKDAVVA